MLAFRRQHHQEITAVLSGLDATEPRITKLYTKAVELTPTPVGTRLSARATTAVLEPPGPTCAAEEAALGFLMRSLVGRPRGLRR